MSYQLLPIPPVSVLPELDATPLCRMAAPCFRVRGLRERTKWNAALGMLEHGIARLSGRVAAMETHIASLASVTGWQPWVAAVLTDTATTDRQTVADDLTQSALLFDLQPVLALLANAWALRALRTRQE